MEVRKQRRSTLVCIAVCLLLLLTAGTWYGIRASADEGDAAQKTPVCIIAVGVFCGCSVKK